MGRIEKTVFISYRRTNLPWALNIYQHLTQHGYDVFFDYQSIDSGDFEKIILDNIKAKAHFLIVLTPSALDRCNKPNDWLRREIETALDTGRNVIPLMMEGFDFGNPNVQKALTGKLTSLPIKNGLPLYSEYFFEGMERLRTRFLNIALEDVPTIELDATAKAATERLKETANNLPAVGKEELTAQEWFERGYKLDDNSNEEIRCYTEAIRLTPNFAEAYYNRGIVHSNQGNIKTAIADYKKAIEINPENTEAYSNLGILLDGLERYDEAEEAYRKAIQINPENAAIYYNLGILLGDLERYDEAEEAYRKAIQINPENAAAYFNLGILLGELERYDEAEDAYRKAIEFDPKDAEAYSNLGILLAVMERYDEAEDTYRKAIEFNLENTDIYYDLGFLLSALKRYDEAEDAYRKAIEFNPEDADTYYNLGLLLKVTKRYDEAEESYRKAIEFNPEDADTYYDLGLACQLQDKFKESLANYYKAIELKEDHGIAHMSLFGLLKKLRKKDEAKKHEKIAHKLIKKDDEYNRACFESLCGNVDEALALLKIAIEKELSDKEWAKEDPDFENLRDDPRFWEIVGEEMPSS